MYFPCSYKHLQRFTFSPFLGAVNIRATILPPGGRAKCFPREPIWSSILFQFGARRLRGSVIKNAGQSVSGSIGNLGSSFILTREGPETASFASPAIAGVGGSRFESTCIANCADRKHAQKRIVKHVDMLLDLRALWPKLTFCQSTMTDALLEVLKGHVDWDLRPVEANDWATTIAGRVRAMCRRLTQAEIKSPRAPWLRRFGLPPPKGEVTSSANDCMASNDSCTPTSTDADENAEDVHVIVVKGGFIGVARDTARRVGHMRDRAAATTADLGIWSFVFHGVGRRGWISCTLPSELRRETQGAANVEQGYAGALGFFFCATVDRTFNSNAF